MTKTTNSKAHAGKFNQPLCGSKGTAQGHLVLVCSPATWNNLQPEQRCEKCIAKIRANKEGAT